MADSTPHACSFVPGALITAWHFACTRWLLRFRSRARLERWQARRLAPFLDQVLPRAPLYRHARGIPLAALPLMDKRKLMDEFDQRNTRGITRERALAVALEAERSRDFTPTLGDVSVGLSSGTSGTRGIFLVSAGERLQWAGVLLAKTLPANLLWQLLLPWRPRLRIAFFLRANNNLYETLHSRRIDFRFFDLLHGTAPALAALNAAAPHVVVAPATVLKQLAHAATSGKLKISPQHVISVAEVLESADAHAVERAFGTRPHQIYQATEGFLGYTCDRGNLHLNETHLYIEKHWLDASQSRFHPVITDFSRTTQLIVRYRLDDVLRAAPAPCPCGRAETHIAAIEGRADEVLWLRHRRSRELCPVYPDLLRRAMLLVSPALDDYRITQRGARWEIEVGICADGAQAIADIRARLAELCAQLELEVPVLDFMGWQPPVAGAKRQRLRYAACEAST